ncbi:hypothetical protein CPLU01_05714 [Colletotrichum plurivorum]|uniref:Uncharacterized protein n=1 Tax=Colletotrichum plurivorum TaxID=2175906 RepID=A0A8H6NHW5_9PEZI|nr:hypothetical protein CPLU01_05714 [Colletotrichum plurivorum]
MTSSYQPTEADGGIDSERKASVTETLNPVRYCFRVQVEKIPGPPLGRSITLANDFMRRNFDREFSWDLDYVYTPTNIGGEGKAWILIDVYKSATPSPKYGDVKLKVFRVGVVEEVM